MSASAKRRPRDPEATREAILEAVRTLLAKVWSGGHQSFGGGTAGRRYRGTAYQHFATREKLIQETVDWVSDKLFRAAFGDPATIASGGSRKSMSRT